MQPSRLLSRRDASGTSAAGSDAGPTDPTPSQTRTRTAVHAVDLRKALRQR